jgi:hypothetical protein
MHTIAHNHDVDLEHLVGLTVENKNGSIVVIDRVVRENNLPVNIMLHNCNVRYTSEGSCYTADNQTMRIGLVTIEYTSTVEQIGSRTLVRRIFL